MPAIFRQPVIVRGHGPLLQVLIVGRKARAGRGLQTPSRPENCRCVDYPQHDGPAFSAGRQA
jgi:hypothetical protein